MQANSIRLVDVFSWYHLIHLLHQGNTSLLDEDPKGNYKNNVLRSVKN